MIVGSFFAALHLLRGALGETRPPMRAPFVPSSECIKVPSENGSVAFMWVLGPSGSGAPLRGNLLSFMTFAVFILGVVLDCGGGSFLSCLFWGYACVLGFDRGWDVGSCSVGNWVVSSETRVVRWGGSRGSLGL